MSETARRATETDLARLVELHRAAVADLREERGGAMWAVREARPEPVEQALADSLADPGGCVIVGSYANAVVGYAAAHTEVLRDGSRLAVLDEIFVEPEARDVAVGEMMMEEVLGWCRELGCRGIDALALPGMRHSKNFFERFGLTARAIIVHRRLTDPS